MVENYKDCSITAYNNMAPKLRELARQYWTNKCIEAAKNNSNDCYLFIEEVNKWAMEQAKKGFYEGWFNISSFTDKYPDFNMDIMSICNRLHLCGYRILSKFQKANRFHPAQVHLNWMNEDDYDYYYCGGRD